MTFLMFILGILLILCIARYNESNKLFWTLLTAYVLCFTVVKVVKGAFNEKEQSEQSLNQAYPTQGLDLASDTCMCFLAGEPMKTIVKETSKPVGQANTPDYVEEVVTLSDVSVVTPGQYLHTLPNPPNSVILFDTS